MDPPPEECADPCETARCQVLPIAKCMSDNCGGGCRDRWFVGKDDDVTEVTDLCKGVLHNIITIVIIAQ